MTTYKEFHQYSIEKPDQFWTEQAQLIDWKEPFTQVCDYSRPRFRSGSWVARPTFAITPLTVMPRSARTTAR